MLYFNCISAAVHHQYFVPFHLGICFDDTPNIGILLLSLTNAFEFCGRVEYLHLKDNSLPLCKSVCHVLPKVQTLQNTIKRRNSYNEMMTHRQRGLVRCSWSRQVWVGWWCRSDRRPQDLQSWQSERLCCRNRRQLSPGSQESRSSLLTSGCLKEESYVS